MVANDEWWDPNDPALASGLGPHEPSAARRLQLRGYKGPEIMEELNYRGPHLMRTLMNDMTNENEAHSKSRPIHTATVPAGTV